jgi:hypothetical protein
LVYSRRVDMRKLEKKRKENGGDDGEPEAVVDFDG